MAAKRRLLLAGGAAALGLGAASAAHADGLSVSSIAPMAIGNVVAANTGNTVFQIDESTGAVSKLSGGGLRTSTGSARSLVTIHCGSDNNCRDDDVHVRVGPVAVYVNRGRGLTNFTASVASGDFRSGTVTASNPLDFKLKPIGKNDSTSFYVGADFPIAGDDSGSNSGISSASFYVYIAFGNTTPTSGSFGGVASAVVTQGLGLSSSGTLNFGKLIRPASGNGTAVISADDGNYYNNNIATIPVTGAPSRVLFTATGEPSRQLSITIPGHFNLTRTTGGATLEVAVSSNAGSSGSLNSSGTYTFGVGGSINVTSSTLTGVYTGSFTVSIAYN